MHRVLALYSTVNRLAARIGHALQGVSPLLARIVVGVVFAQSGWGKLNDLASVTEFFTSLGLPAPAFQAVLASTTELVCGVLLLFGLATRFAAVPLIVTMIVAIRTALWDQVEGVASLFTMIEFLYIVLCVWLATNGPGPVSIDALIEPRLAADAGAPTGRAALARLGVGGR
ncbi:MAG: DoxX family protein [Candidatus Binatia bacterium]